jgi:hypothetical protein
MAPAMRPDSSSPAEVRAARRAQEQPAVTGTVSVSDSTLPPNAPISPDVDQLLEEILAADRVDIVGVLPWQCGARLVELAARRRDAGQSVIHPTAVRYLTPARDRITLYRHSGVLGRLVQRWIAGVCALSNWLQPAAADPLAPDALTIYVFDDVFLDCVIHTKNGEAHNVTSLSQLPVVKGFHAEDEPTEDATLVLSRMLPDQVRQFQQYLELLVTQATPMLPRELLCRLDAGGEELKITGNEFRPIITQLHISGRLRPSNVVEPVAIVVVCASTARGPIVLLKRRSERNSRDDFGTLSLISERVMEEDLIDLIAGPFDVDESRALDELWLRAGKPAEFEIPESAFRSAAQRELFLRCGLDVSGDRLDLRGTCLLDREGEGGTYLGFFVFRIELIRAAGPGVDELEHARSWNPDLEAILLNELYLPPTHARLNRLLRRRDAWLQESVFRPRAQSEGKVSE